jgi:hypothetical protein
VNCGVNRVGICSQPLPNKFVDSITFSSSRQSIRPKTLKTLHSVYFIVHSKARFPQTEILTSDRSEFFLTTLLPLPYMNSRARETPPTHIQQWWLKHGFPRTFRDNLIMRRQIDRRNCKILMTEEPKLWLCLLFPKRESRRGICLANNHRCPKPWNKPLHLRWSSDSKSQWC